MSRYEVFKLIEYLCFKIESFDICGLECGVECEGICVQE